MRPTDFFVRGRQLFGFIIPGAVWLSALVVALGHNPLAVLEQGQVLVRAVLFTGVSYVVGFAIQTVVFQAMHRWLKRCPPAELVKQVQTELTRQVNAIGGGWSIDPAHLPVFCKLYVLEHSPELQTVLREHEDDINLIVAIPPAICALGLATLYHSGAGIGLIAGSVVVVLVFSGLLWKHLLSFRESEQREWCEMFLLLQLRDQRSSEPEAKVLGERPH